MVLSHSSGLAVPCYLSASTMVTALLERVGGFVCACVYESDKDETRNASWTQHTSRFPWVKTRRIFASQVDLWFPAQSQGRSCIWCSVSLQVWGFSFCRRAPRKILWRREEPSYWDLLSVNANNYCLFCFLCFPATSFLNLHFLK